MQGSHHQARHRSAAAVPAFKDPVEDPAALSAPPRVTPGPDTTIPPIVVHPSGAVSAINDPEDPILRGEAPTVYANRDGHRVDDGRYTAFEEAILSQAGIPAERVVKDPVRTFAYGTDASFYRLVPRMVVKLRSEAEVQRVLPIAKRLSVPVTFRAAGTSLSGQALTDSVLLKISHVGDHFRNHEVHGDGSSITVEPGLIGGEVNRILADHHRRGKHPIQYKIGPDPSSIDSSMIGGVVNNNSSGMCCGVSQNTYHTIKDLRVVFLDGTLLDTADPVSRASFLANKPELVDGLLNLARKVQADPTLSALIRRKFSIKCTTGYSLNALVDFPARLDGGKDQVFEILKHLVVGSEGTLGFVSRATYHTVPEWPNKASAFVMFPDVMAACEAASVLRDETAVDAVEMFDRASLKQCVKDDRFVNLVHGDVVNAGPRAAGLLIECRGRDADALAMSIAEVQGAIARANFKLGCTDAEAAAGRAVTDFPFTEKPDEYNVFWDVRKGLIPLVGGAREPGTSMLIEDVACPVDKLGQMTVDLVEMFERHGYDDASCFGHALEGNLHLVFSQGFRTPEEVQRFRHMMDEMCDIVATKHSGSLKAEHGTGRNIAPYVELEWGPRAARLQWEIKALFDPDHTLNPGVITNNDPEAHMRFLKPAPVASPLVDRCIECGFCESNCPSRDETLTPRQRITTFREAARLRSLGDAAGPAEKARLAAFENGWDYLGERTCAADGMCQEKCPVKINTGELVKSVRSGLHDTGRGSGVAAKLADPATFSTVSKLVPSLLNTVDFARSVLGAGTIESISGALNRATDRSIPEWNRSMPKGASKIVVPAPPPAIATDRGVPRKVVYAPACVTRMMGPARDDPDQRSTHEALMSLFAKAGYEVIIPEGIDGTCCGMMFNSRGFKSAGQSAQDNFEQILFKASEGGRLPVVVDTSPCLSQLKSSTTAEADALRFSLYEPVSFIRNFLADKLEWTPRPGAVAVHVPCSSKKMGLMNDFNKVASLCSEDVVPTDIPCCGMAGDRGLRYPELTGASLQHLKKRMERRDVTAGFSTSRTCEMSLSNHGGVPFQGLVHLADAQSKPLQAKN